MKKRTSTPVDVLNALLAIVKYSAAARWDRSGHGWFEAVEQRRRATTRCRRLPPSRSVWPRAHLAGVVEQDQAHRPGDGDSSARC